jgi:hypothetical protein
LNRAQRRIVRFAGLSSELGWNSRDFLFPEEAS